MVGLKKFRITAYLLVSLSVVTLLSGCGGAMGVAGILRVAKVAAVVQKQWNENKAIIAIVADIVSGSSLKEVIAKIFRSGQSEPVEIILTSNLEGKFEGTFESVSTETAPVTYTAVVEVTDTTGAMAASEPVNVDVPIAPDAP